MPEDFRGPFLKWNRAKTHLEELRGLLHLFMERQTFVAVANLDLEPGYVWWIARGDHLFEYDGFSPIIGDVISNLHDGLEIAMSVLMRNAGERDTGIHFPTGDLFGNFQEAIGKGPKRPKKPVRIPASVIKVLETRIQPYNGGNGYLLRTLRDLSVMDKHRMIVPTFFGVSIVIRYGNPILFPDERVAIENGCKLLRVPIDRCPDVKVNEEAGLALSIEFDSGTSLDGTAVEDGLLHLVNVTEEAFEALERCCIPVTAPHYFQPINPSLL